jgi:UDP-N-acetylmuramoyl-tripeptide--D-alanyl-D-alanine ligase
MRDMTVKKLHETVGGRLRLDMLAPPRGEDAPIGRIVTDSREVRAGDVFWGLAGTRLDGAGFAAEAYSRGATGAVVGKKYVQPWPGCWSLEVEDAQQALNELASWNRQRLVGRVVAVTGSVGKTTTRQMIRAVLGEQLCGSASPKNFNNHVGLPLSMLSIDPADDFAVLELAANAPGEIGRLAALCRPHVGVITRVGDAHLGGFGLLAAVAEAKAELIGALPDDGWAVAAGDDEMLRKLSHSWRPKVVWFGRSLDNDVIATHVESRQGRLSFCIGNVPMSVGVWGRHHLCDALAAVAVGRIFGLSDTQIAAGLDNFQPPPMRCQITNAGGATIIDDTYNASPMAMRAAFELLRDFDAPGRRIVVVGDMRELGDAAGALHRKLGDQVVTLCGADLLVACGDHAPDVVAGARAAGMPSARTIACRRPEDFLARRECSFEPGDVVLIKGSRALAMERLVKAFQAREPQCVT